MRKRKNTSAIARIPIAVEDDPQTMEQKIRAALESLFGKAYVYIGSIPDFDEALFKRISADQHLARISSQARMELLMHQRQKQAGQNPVWGCRSLPADRGQWAAQDLVSAYYLACQPQA